ncbi:hypothetical protein Tco_1539627 [Tanacetum coccineum]
MDEGTKNYSFYHIFVVSNSSVLIDKTKSTGDGLKTAHTYSGVNEESRANDISLKVKLEDLFDILKDTRSAFFTPDSPPDEPIIISNESEEEEEVPKDKDNKATSHDVPKDTSVPPPLSPKLAQIQELMDQLKKHVRDMEIELSGDLKEIPTKLETFTSTISSLSSQVAELKNNQWELPSEFLNFPSQVCHHGGKCIRTTSMNVPSAGKATASPAEGEKNTKYTKTNLQKQLIDRLGIEVVEQYHSKKLLFDKYCDKMLKTRKSSKIINCDVLTQKGPISLKVYREDGLSEVIENLKVSDLYLAEWREVVQACLDRREKG